MSNFRMYQLDLSVIYKSIETDPEASERDFPHQALLDHFKWEYDNGRRSAARLAITVAHFARVMPPAWATAELAFESIQYMSGHIEHVHADLHDMAQKGSQRKTRFKKHFMATDFFALKVLAILGELQNRKRIVVVKGRKAYNRPIGIDSGRELYAEAAELFNARHPIPFCKVTAADVELLSKKWKPDAKQK